ncbi:MAG: hypothetical protein PGN23_10850 [Sphingomonas adhaesiva]|uniref:hypothetical protein n=1 Tax=Sphingomonas adhaesiva TaxID=28212 RepID=UPI002FF879A3
MTAARRHARIAVGLSLALGAACVLGGLWLLPGRTEVATAADRAVPPPPRRFVPPAPARPAAAAEPSLAALIHAAPAPALAEETARLNAAGRPVTTLQVAWDLLAAGRAGVALAYIALRPDRDAPALWPVRLRLLKATGRRDDAATLLASPPAGVAPHDVVAAGYALDRADLIAAAIAKGALPAEPAALMLDLIRRMDAADRRDLVAALDRRSTGAWRRADPWLALRIATRDADIPAALRAIDLLPPGERDTARETLLTRTGDRAALRTLWLAEPDRAAAAEKLLAAGFRADAIATLRTLAATLSPGAPAAQRLLYLMGPRPRPADLAWLRDRTLTGDAADQRAWIAAYAPRDRPAAALAFLSRHPLAQSNALLLTRLSLADSAGDTATAGTIVATLLDGRALAPGELRAIDPRALPPGPAQLLARRRIAAGIATPAERLDLAWAAWNRGDAPGTIAQLTPYLADRPQDAVALRLMADAQAKAGGTTAARPYWERALAASPDADRTRAELLDRLGRRAEALRLVETLRADAPADRRLAALQARLLIAMGQPGRARAVLAP